MNIQRYSFLIIGIIFALSCSENKTGKEGFVSSGDPEIDRLTLELQKNDKDPKLYAMRGTKYYEKESFDNAIVDFKQAIRLDSLNPIYYHQLADTYLDYYNSKDAIGTLLQVLQMYPERVPTLLKLAEFKHIVEDYDGSILTLNEVVRLDPQNAESYFMLGMNFRALGDRERAINSFQTAVENDSQLTDAWLILGDLYEEKKDPKALKYFESAILSNLNVSSMNNTFIYNILCREMIEVPHEIPQRGIIFVAPGLNPGSKMEIAPNFGVIFAKKCKNPACSDAGRHDKIISNSR
jgi:tetratricopeptide (TPR) repeat protein